MSQRYAGGVLTANQNPNYSGTFDGINAGNFLSVAGASQYAIATSTTPFTVEAWVKLRVAGGLVFAEEFGAPSIVMACGFVLTNDISAPTGLYPAFGYYVSAAWTTAAVSTTPIVLNTWTHVAFVFTGSTSKIYMNGVDVTKSSAPTPATTWGVTATNGTNWYIGRRWDTTPGGTYIGGNVSNFRFVNGTAVYTSNFLPPTTLTAITNTVLLTCQSPTFVDNSPYAATITSSGAVVDSASPFYTQTDPALGAATNGVWTLSQATQAAAQRSWPMYDPEFNVTTAMVHGNGANGATNSTFLDSSANNFTVTKNGNAAQGTFTPFSKSPGYFSAYIGGLGNYITASGAAFAATQTTFTVEAWVYMTAIPGGNPTLVGDMLPTGTTLHWSFGVNSTYRVAFVWYDGASKSALGTTRLSLGTWYHIAISVNANAISMYVNGAQETLTGTTTLTNRGGTTGTTVVGQAQSSSFYYTGYVSNLSILNGTAKYSSSFTPPTAPLPTDTTNQVFLFGGYNRLYDANTATTPKTLTLASNGSRVATDSPFYRLSAYTPDVNSGSAFFDGTGDYLTVSGDANLAFGTNDFTIELFLYLTAFPAQEVIYDARPSGTNGAYPCIYLSGSTSKFSYLVSSANRIVSDNNYVFNSWTHLVVSRVSGTTRMFVNGVQQTGTYADSTTYLNGTSRPTIGCAGDTIGNGPWFGYISNVRVLNGTGVTSVTVPTAPLTPITNTQLLLSGTNAAIFDNATNLNIETVNASISTAQSKYGSGSMAFNGTNAYARIYTPSGNGARVVQTLGDFTAECWINPTVANVQQTIFFLNGTGGFGGCRLDINTTGGIQLLVSINGTAHAINAANTYATPTGVWSHVAVVRQGPSFIVYFNGSPIITSTAVGITTAIHAGTISAIGSVFIVSFGGFFNGYISDFRVTNYARYLGTFTPPTSTLQNQ